MLPDALVHPANELDEGEARRIATSYAHTFGRFVAFSWEAAHGAPVRYAALAACGRAVYAGSAFKPLSIDLSDSARRTFGPHWIVVMCQPGDGPSVVITFSSLALELSNSRDSVRQAGYTKTDFRSHGIPMGIAGRTLFSPEGAAQYAHDLCGRRIASVPELVMAPMPSAPAAVRWRVGFELPVQVKGKTRSAPRLIQDTYVGFDGVFARSG